MTECAPLNQDVIVGALRSFRFSFQSERDLQDGIARALESSGFAFKREVKLSEKDRIDFMVGGVGIEVKSARWPLAQVTRQLYRYAESPMVEAVILVTARSRHRQLPATMAGKPLHVEYLIGSLL